MSVKQDSSPSSLEMRTLNVELPACVYWHLRECATLSRMSLKEFMSEFGLTAQPITASRTDDDVGKTSDRGDPASTQKQQSHPAGLSVEAQHSTNC